VLVVVDTSYGMDSIQKGLASQIDILIQGLTELPGGANYRFGVVTTDLGAGENVTKSCTEKGDQGLLKVPPDCALENGVNYLEHVGSKINSSLSASEVASCLIQQGSNGCGFEQTLEAMKVALEGNPKFLRPKAGLVVVILTSEDDCSAIDTKLFSWKDQSFGPYADYRCFQYGVLCKGEMPPLTEGTVNSCAPGQDYLHPVESRYVSFLKTLKPLEWIAVLVLALPTKGSYTISKKWDNYYSYYVVDSTCPSSTKMRGMPGIRLATFADAFSSKGVFGQICSNTYDVHLEKLISQIKLMYQQGPVTK
jgi:hypothetical protein